MLSFAKKGNNPIYAMQCFLTGFKLLAKKELRKFLWIPLLINLCLYTAALAIAYFYLVGIVATFIPNWLQWLSWLLIPLFFACFFVVMFFTFTILANLLASPFYTQLAEKTLLLLYKEDESEDKSSAPPVTVEVKWTTMMKGELRRISYLIKWMIPLVILSFIPVINLIAPVMWAIFAAWGMALEFLAYPLENKGLVFPEQKKLISSVRFGSLTLGGITMGGLAVPVFNLLVSPTAVIAATVYTYGLSQEDEPEQSQDVVIESE